MHYSGVMRKCAVFVFLALIATTGFAQLFPTVEIAHYHESLGGGSFPFAGAELQLRVINRARKKSVPVTLTA